MIRYPVTEAQLTSMVNGLAPTWLADAATRTAAFERAGKYNETQGSWSRIKDAYLTLQYNKCAYCERPFAGPPEGRIEHDVEHFRPKSGVKAWPTPAIARSRKLSYRFATGDALPAGYYLLAYSLFNYATACKTCNSSFKASYFPIARQRGRPSAKPADYAAERAYIPYPLGNLDEDPERIITFQGIVPVPTARSTRSVRHRRARITIDFFRLDVREELLEGRARVIQALWSFLDQAENARADHVRTYALESIELAIDLESPHASCARAFVALYQADSGRATQYFVEAHEYLKSKRSARDRER